MQSNPEGAVGIYMTDTDKVGTKALTVKNLGTEYFNTGGVSIGTPFRIFRMYDKNGAKRNKYRNGENLMLGNAV